MISKRSYGMKKWFLQVFSKLLFQMRLPGNAGKVVEIDFDFPIFGFKFTVDSFKMQILNIRFQFDIYSIIHRKKSYIITSQVL